MRDAEKVDKMWDLEDWGVGVGAVNFSSLLSFSSGFSLYLRCAAVPLQSGSPWAYCF